MDKVKYEMSIYNIMSNSGKDTTCRHGKNGFQGSKSMWDEQDEEVNFKGFC